MACVGGPARGLQSHRLWPAGGKGNVNGRDSPDPAGSDDRRAEAVGSLCRGPTPAPADAAARPRYTAWR